MQVSRTTALLELVSILVLDVSLECMDEPILCDLFFSTRAPWLELNNQQ